MSRWKLPTVLVVLLVLAAASFPAGAVAASTQTASLQVDVQQAQDSGDATVTVTRNGSAVSNATVVVSGDDYAGNGTYATDENGTVVLPNPNSTVDVTVEAYDSGETTSTSVTLVPHADSLDVSVSQQDDGNATVEVTQYGMAVENATVDVSGDDYAGNGSYSTDENGTVWLPAPSDTVDLNVTAADGTLTAETTATLYADDLELAVEQAEDGPTTVTVTRNGSAVENASVTVSGDAYAGNGTYLTDENGTVGLPAPEEPVNVTVTATHENDTVESNVTLHPKNLALDVSQTEDGAVTVTVTRNGTAVQNATVNVSGEAYAGNGSYSTDENGTVGLPAPEEPVDVNVTATHGADSVTKSVHLLTYDLSVDVTEHDDRSATVTVTRNGTTVSNATVNVSSDTAYAGNGTYSTDENGTVDLPAPEEDVTITVNASDDGDTASTTANLTGAPEKGDLGIGVSQGADRVVIAVTDMGVRQNATVTISGDSDLAGTYQTGNDGFLVLDAPSNDTMVTIHAETDSAMSERQVELEGSIERGPGHTPFGLYVSAYVDSLQHDPGLTGMYGHYVSDFVHDFKDDHAGAAGDAGPNEADDHPGNGNGQANANGNGQDNGNDNSKGPGASNGNGNNNGDGPENDGQATENGPGNGHGNGNPGNGKA